MEEFEPDLEEDLIDIYEEVYKILNFVPYRSIFEK